MPPGKHLEVINSLWERAWERLQLCELPRGSSETGHRVVTPHAGEVSDPDDGGLGCGEHSCCSGMKPHFSKCKRTLSGTGASQCHPNKLYSTTGCTQVISPHPADDLTSKRPLAAFFSVTASECVPWSLSKHLESKWGQWVGKSSHSALGVQDLRLPTAWETLLLEAAAKELWTGDMTETWVASCSVPAPARDGQELCDSGALWGEKEGGVGCGPRRWAEGTGSRMRRQTAETHSPFPRPESRTVTGQAWGGPRSARVRGANRTANTGDASTAAASTFSTETSCTTVISIPKTLVLQVAEI